MPAKKPEKEFSVIHQANVSRGFSPYRLIDRSEKEIIEVNNFLDALATRGLSPRSIRTYAFGLLKFWTWLTEEKRALSKLTEADFFHYIRFQKIF